MARTPKPTHPAGGNATSRPRRAGPMTASELKTVVLHRRLAEHMDTETADALIERLPPDWEQLATKADLAQLRTDLTRDLRTVTYMIIGFALAVVGMFATILVAGVPAAG